LKYTDNHLNPIITGSWETM